MEVLKEKGVPEHRILFLNLIASPSGVAEFAERFPKLRVVTAFIDQGLDEKKYNSPTHIVFSFLVFRKLTTLINSQIHCSRSWRFR